MQEITRDIPEIRINFSELLYRGECQTLDLTHNKGVTKLLTADRYRELTEGYRKAWAQYEETLLRGMTDVLGVSFYRPVIDVTLAPYFRPKSTPLIIGFRSKPDEFIDILTHELLHVLQTDNNKHQAASSKPKINLLQEWQRLFGEHENLALVHIPVHALHKYLYLDVLKAPKRLQRDMELTKESKTGRAYVQAWDYVNGHDYAQIVRELRSIYK